MAELSMREVWCRRNTRPLLVVALAPTLLLLMASGVVLLGAGFAAGVLAGLAVAGFLTLAGLWLWFRWHPLLGYEAGSLLCWLNGARPIRVPIEVVEGFLLGQGPSYLPGKAPARLDTNTLVIRLAERAAEWEQVETNSRLAGWCGHYVTIRGTWSEPLTLALVNRLNQRLYDVTHPPPTAGVAS
ncbi:MAG: hypothetical protein JSS27_01210 [Planctomycetes bacterium]|nr:hypothetical protein [Planctomycetota bacterium]